MEYEIKTLPAYRAMGLKCDVSFTDFETIKTVIENSMSRVKEFDYPVNPGIRLGLSYHLRPDGFTYYSVYEVQDKQPLLDNMVEINIPEMTYLVAKYNGESIEGTYENIMKWIKESDYTPFKEEGVDYYDELPIKHEKYLNGESDFEILIPIK
ncbi:GyrI-like domain-containing protein [Oceanobacillus sp. FSL W7-1293]|uniref:GyrI-like domain-containing protein n=1 Tax=Oceanobacillus TaxID=182709 RepID=UPI0030CE33FE